MFRRFFIVIVIFMSFLQIHCSDFKAIFNGGSRTSKNKKTTKTNKNGRDPIKTKEGIYYFVATGDTLSEISDDYKIHPLAVAEINGLFINSNLAVGRRLFIPHRKKRSKYVNEDKIKEAQKQYRDAHKKKSDSKFIWPMKTGYISSKFGMRRGRPHNGIDIAARIGTPIYAVYDGKVLHAKYFTTYGNLIVLQHNNGYYSAYAHSSKLFVKKGQKVKQGQKIANVGKTGRSTGPHLHFEIHKRGGIAIDPIKVLPKKKGNTM